MKAYKILLLICTLPLALTGCFDDDTTLGNRPISEIFIEEGSIDSVYNIYRNEQLVIAPVLSQSNKEKPLNYSWEIDLEEYSTESVFTYTGKQLGTFNCRFVVENEDGKTYFPFVLNVNSPYEEGLAVISCNDEGESMLSFMKTPLPGENIEGFFNYDCFTVNNPDTKFASNVSDILQSSGQLLISAQGGNSDDDLPSVYYLNEKTLIVENVLTAPEYPDFVPTMMCVPSMESTGVTYPILCSNNKVYEFSTTEGQLEPSTSWRSEYAQKCVVYGKSSSRFDIILWDNNIGGSNLGGLQLYYNGYGPYVCNEDWDAVRKGSTRPDTLNYFSGRNLVNMTLVRMTDEQLATSNPEFVIVTKKGTLMYRNVMYTGFWVTDLSTYESVLVNNEKMIGFGSAPFDINTPCIANRTYYSFLFADGNKVRRWYYATQQVSTADDLLTVGSDSAVITGFEISADHKKTYVSFYEPQQSGKNGSVWVFDTDSGEVLEKYDNIAYRPVKMIYKKK